MTTTDATIRPFEVHVPDEDLADLRRRIAATRWPPWELVADQSQGGQRATVQDLAKYWATEYDRRKCEAKLNALLLRQRSCPPGLAPGRLHGVCRRDLPGPRSWAEQVDPNPIYFHEAGRGGHFAAWEEPQLFSRGTPCRLPAALLNDRIPGRHEPDRRRASDMSIVVVVTAFPVPEHRAEVVAAFEAAIDQVHGEPGVELYALHEGRDRLVMIEKYESERARSEHRKGTALADLRSALEGKLSSNLDAQVLVPHPAGDPQKGAL